MATAVRHIHPNLPKKFVVTETPFTWKEMIERFLDSRRNGTYGANGIARDETIRTYLDNLEKLVEFMGQKRRVSNWNDVSEEDIGAYIKSINKEKKAAATRYQHFRTLKALMNFIKRDPGCKKRQMPIYLEALPKIPRNPARAWIPSMELVMKLLSVPNQQIAYEFRDYVMMMVVLDSGIRNGEVCNLKAEDINWFGRELKVHGKGKSARTVPVTEKTLLLLERWMKLREGLSKTPYVFCTRYGGKNKNQAIAHQMKKYCQRVGIEEQLTLHTLRHYFATHYLINGGREAKLRGILGHLTHEMMQVYVNYAELAKQSVEEHPQFSPANAFFQSNGKLVTKPVKRRQMVRQ